MDKKEKMEITAEDEGALHEFVDTTLIPLLKTKNGRVFFRDIVTMISAFNSGIDSMWLLAAVNGNKEDLKFFKMAHGEGLELAGFLKCFDYFITKQIINE